MPSTVPNAASGLSRFQDGFARALLDDAAEGHDAAMLRLIEQPAFAVYRNTVLKGCIDALAANYPAVLRLVGEEWFRAAATVYSRRDLPQQPMLLDYGAGFAQFLEGFEPAAELPYLASVARLDRFWSEAHFARDETPLDAALVARLEPTRLAQVVLRPHASARWAWFPTMPIRTIWQRNRNEPAMSVAGDEIDWRGEGVLIVRPRGAVDVVALDAAGCAFMDACADGGTLLAAAQAATEADVSVDLTRLADTLFSAGAFAAPELPDIDRDR
jgi:hypothetical protein